MADVAQIVVTAGPPSGRYAPERVVKATDYQGVLDTLGGGAQNRIGAASFT